MGNTASSYHKQQNAAVSTDDDSDLLNDADYRRFDAGLKKRTQNVLASLEHDVLSGGIEIASLKSVTTQLAEMDKDVVQYLLRCEEDVWGNVEIYDLVDEYFTHSLEALDFCGVLEKSVQHARDNQMIIEVAVGHMPENGNPSQEQCQQTLDELQNFSMAENPFATEFYEQFKKVYDRQVKLQVKLLAKKRRLDKKLKVLDGMRKVTTIIWNATCVSLVICAAVAVAIAAPATVGRVSARTKFPIESMNWLNSLWDKYENKIRYERKAFEGARWGTYVVIKDLESIQHEVTRLRNEINAINRNIDFGRERGDPISVQIAVQQIKRKQREFTIQLEELSTHVDDCLKQIRGARQLVLQRIMNHPK